MNVPKMPPSQSDGKTAAIHTSLKARNSAVVISPDASQIRDDPARDMPGDLHIAGFVGEDETGGCIAFHQSSENRAIGSVAANDAMRTKLENIADPGDRSCGVGLERPLL
jgi:hypothetical protein